MDEGDVICNQVNDLFGGIGDASLLHGDRIAAKSVNDFLEAAGQYGTGQGTDTMDLFAGRDGHNAGDNRDMDTGFLRFPDEIVEDVVVEEHLCGQEGAARIYLALQVVDVYRR